MLIYFNNFVAQIKRRKRGFIRKKEVSGWPPLVVAPGRPPLVVVLGRPPLPPPVPPPLSPSHVMPRVSFSWNTLLG